MESLDTKLLANIIGYLVVRERMKMRLVSKKFKNVVDSTYVPKDLVVATDYDFFNRWKVSNACIDIRNCHVFSLNLSVPTPMLNDLQRLKVKFQLSYDDLKRLQSLPKLAQLEVGLLELGTDSEPIRLPNLRTLFVYDVNKEERGCLTIDSPKIQNAYFANHAIEFVKFADYKTITFLEFCRDEKNCCLVYTNLVLAVCNAVLELSKSTLIALAKLPRLRYLHCNMEIMRCADVRPDEEAVRRLREVHDLLTTLQDFGEVKPELTCFIHDVPLTTSRSFDEYHFGESYIRLHHENAHYTLTEKSPSIEAASYVNFLTTVRKYSKHVFLRRYLNIQCVDVFSCEKRFKFSRLSAFLSLCRQIRSITICYVDIKTRHLLQLPSLACLKNLACLQLIHGSKIEMDFILRFEFLNILNTNLVNMDRITIVKQLNPGLYEFFVDGENSLKIRKHRRANSYDLYLVVCGGREHPHPNVTFGSLYEILQRIDGPFPYTHWLDRGDKADQR